ncbi:hypothetical protein GC194_14040 [bacterium]|nr:hypothetical protein [bacterium]
MAKFINDIIDYYYFYFNSKTKTMLFRKEMQYASFLPAEKIEIILAEITEKSNTNSDNGCYFEGTVGNKQFKLLQTFDYGPNNQLRPELTGTIQSIANGSVVKIDYHLPQTTKAILVAALIFNLGFMTIMIAFPNLIDDPIWQYWWGFPIVLAVSFVLLMVFYNYKIGACEKLLINFLDLNPK